MTESGASVGVPPPIEFRSPLPERLGVAAAALVLISLALAALAGAAALFATEAVVALVLAAVALTVGSLAAFVTGDAVARWRQSATLYAGRLTAFLPRRRGFILGAREELSVAIPDIERIETREEVFSSLGVTTSQRAYEIFLKNAAPVFLGADRAMLPAYFGRIAEAITSRGTAPLIDRGMVDGDPGFLLVAGARVPDWGAAPLPPADAARRTKAKNRTPALLGAAALFVILARIIGG